MGLIAFACPHCGKQVRMPEEKIGYTLPCPHCSRQVTVMQEPSESLKSPIIRRQLDGTMFRDRSMSLLCRIVIAVVISVVCLVILSRLVR